MLNDPWMGQPSRLEGVQNTMESLHSKQSNVTLVSALCVQPVRAEYPWCSELEGPYKIPLSVPKVFSEAQGYLCSRQQWFTEHLRWAKPWSWEDRWSYPFQLPPNSPPTHPHQIQQHRRHLQDRHNMVIHCHCWTSNSLFIKKTELEKERRKSEQGHEERIFMGVVWNQGHTGQPLWQHHTSTTELGLTEGLSTLHGRQLQTFVFWVVLLTWFHSFPLFLCPWISADKGQICWERCVSQMVGWLAAVTPSR